MWVSCPLSEEDRRRLTTDHRPLTTDHRPPTADRRVPTGTRRRRHAQRCEAVSDLPDSGGLS
ncbi:MAG: hypothetical protein ABIG63_03505 [Chloroflexota bacterium]